MRSAVPTGAPVSVASVDGRRLRLPERTLLDTTDVDEVSSVMSSVLAHNDIVVNGSPRRFHALIRECHVGDLWLGHFTFGTGITVRGGPLDCYALNVTLRGRSETRFGRTAVAAAEDEATVFSPSTPTAFTWSDDAEILCVRVPKPAVEQHLHRIGGGRGPIRFETRVGVGSAPWLRSVIGWALSASAGLVGDTTNALSWQLRDSVLTAMLLELTHDWRDLARVGWREPGSRLCDAAIAVMRTALAEPPSIPAIAGRLGVSERSLQVSFREHLDSTPSVTFKQLRLDAVHDALLRGDGRRHTVGRIAAEVGGFTHLGRFAGEYVASFGEYPAETLSRWSRPS